MKCKKLIMFILNIMFFLALFTISIKSYASFPGYIRGIITDAISEKPIEGAKIKTDINASALSRPDGSYLILHEPGTYTVAVEASGYKSQSHSEIVVNEGGTTIVNFELEPATAGCAIDLDFITRSYEPEISSKDIDSTITAEANDEIWVAVVAQNVSNLDTYQVEMNFNPSRMAFIEGYEDSQLNGVTNLLKTNGGTTTGFKAVEQDSGTVNIANTLSGNETNEAPDGSGIIALLKLKVIDSDPDNLLTLSNVRYSDSYGNSEFPTDFMNAVVNSVSDAPKADAGPNQTVDEGIAVTLDGSKSSGEIVSYTWTQLSGISVILSDPEVAKPVFTAPDVGFDGEFLVFKLKVTDAIGMKSTDTCIVNVTWINAAPIANAGPNQTVDGGVTVTLDGSGSSDLDNGIASYQWKQVFGQLVYLSDLNDAKTSFTAPDPEKYSISLVFNLTVTDNHGLEGTDSCIINIQNKTNQPVLSSPANGQTGVSLTPELVTEELSDTDSDKKHGETEWQISKESDFSSLVLDITSSHYLTSFTVPEFVLNRYTTYYWRARFYFDDSGISEWPVPFSFTTTLIPSEEDRNFNGIPDNQEITDPKIDLDLNGIPDVDQYNISSIKTTVGDAQAGITGLANVTSVESVKSVDPADMPGTGGRPEDMLFGLFSLELNVDNPDDVATVNIYFSEPVPDGDKWYNYDPVNGWWDYSEHAAFSDGRKSVRLELKDGGFGDSDGVENGVIIDQSGFGSPSSSSGGDSGDSGDICFIAAIGRSRMEIDIRLFILFMLFLASTLIGFARDTNSAISVQHLQGLLCVSSLWLSGQFLL
ncbi:MAG: hypothetical protein GY795_43700 [Desulfobacterales bacterium]|nr:hypothetical protein [Desulfobacterales bacterium]